jgi:26S proteasome regulatory subunit T4
MVLVRENFKNVKKDLTKTEDDMKALQSVGQLIGEVLKQLDEERCNLLGIFGLFISYC